MASTSFAVSASWANEVRWPGKSRVINSESASSSATPDVASVNARASSRAEPNRSLGSMASAFAHTASSATVTSGLSALGGRGGSTRRSTGTWPA